MWRIAVGNAASATRPRVALRVARPIQRRRVDAEAERGTRRHPFADSERADVLPTVITDSERADTLPTTIGQQARSRP